MIRPGRWVKAGLRGPVELYLRAHHALLGVPEAAVLVLGHMRSGSSLLLHLLASSPEILAAGERNTPYLGPDDLHRLARDCFVVARRPFGRARYVADQLNHDHLLPDPGLILHPKVRCVLLARRPGPSIGSIVRTFAPLYGGWPPERAARYYTGRLHTLAGYARRLRAAGRSPLLVRYEALTSEPQQSLHALRAALDLARPLEAEYEVRGFTGRRGDPSSRILEGRVRPDAGRSVEVPSAWAEAAQAAYDGLLAAAG